MTNILATIKIKIKQQQQNWAILWDSGWWEMNASVKAKPDESMWSKHFLVEISHNHSFKTEQFSWIVYILGQKFFICSRWALRFSPILTLPCVPATSLCSLWLVSPGPCQDPPSFYSCLVHSSLCPPIHLFTVAASPSCPGAGGQTDRQVDRQTDRQATHHVRMHVSELCEEAGAPGEKPHGAS